LITELYVSTTELTSKGNATREAIVNTARSILVEEGYERLVMREVAQRCGIKLGNLQYYFPTKEALLTTVIEREAEKDIATIQGSLQQTDDREALRSVVTELVGRWRGDSGVVFATLNLLMQHHAGYRALYERVYQNFYANIEAAISCALPDLAPAECGIRARLLSALVDGAALQIGMMKKPALRKRLLDEAYRIAVHGG
jgi:AcrR family transcriptional regulator